METVIERKKGDIHIGATYNLDQWFLPFGISWWTYFDNTKKKRADVSCFEMGLHFFCFQVFMEIWSFRGWKTDDRGNETGFTAMPESLLGQFYNACTDPCDMLTGPCACGAWHHQEEWPDDIQVKVFGKISTKKTTLKRRRINDQSA